MSERSAEPWSRLLRRLMERRDKIGVDILSGGCSWEQYLDRCGRYGEIAQTVADMDSIAKGEDLRRPEKPLPLGDEEE